MAEQDNILCRLIALVDFLMPGIFTLCAPLQVRGVDDIVLPDRAIIKTERELLACHVIRYFHRVEARHDGPTFEDFAVFLNNFFYLSPGEIIVHEPRAISRAQTPGLGVNQITVGFTKRNLCAVIGQRFQVSGLSGDLAFPGIQGVVKGVMFIKTQPQPDMPDRKQIDHFQCQSAGILLFHA